MITTLSLGRVLYLPSRFRPSVPLLWTRARLQIPSSSLNGRACIEPSTEITKEKSQVLDSTRSNKRRVFRDSLQRDRGHRRVAFRSSDTVSGGSVSQKAARYAMFRSLLGIETAVPDTTPLGVSKEVEMRLEGRKGGVDDGGDE